MADKGFSFIDLLISKESQYFTLFERETTSFKEKLQKYIGHCKSQNTCRASNCTDKRLSNFEWSISSNHEDLLDIFFNLCCYYKFNTTSCPIMNQNETGLSVYYALIFV